MKKRKHSDSGPTAAPKSSRTRDPGATSALEGDNEVSSSSETDAAAARLSGRVAGEKRCGPLDSFLRSTQQREVSTSGQEAAGSGDDRAGDLRGDGGDREGGDITADRQVRRSDSPGICSFYFGKKRCALVISVCTRINVFVMIMFFISLLFCFKVSEKLS